DDRLGGRAFLRLDPTPPKMGLFALSDGAAGFRSEDPLADFLRPANLRLQSLHRVFAWPALRRAVDRSPGSALAPARNVVDCRLGGLGLLVAVGPQNVSPCAPRLAPASFLGLRFGAGCDRSGGARCPTAGNQNERWLPESSARRLRPFGAFRADLPGG